MSDEEYEVLDELYFVTGYARLKERLSYSDSRLLEVLRSLSRKGWIRVLHDPDEGLSPGTGDWEQDFSSYFYLASKEGLKAHNSK